MMKPLWCIALLLALASSAWGQQQEEALFEQEDPAVQAVLESNPQTPADALRAVITLLDLGAPEAAQGMLAKLLQADLDNNARADLARTLGSGELLRLTAQPALDADAKTFVQSLLIAADERSRDPERLARLIAQLDSPDAAVRRAAIVDLREGKTDAVAALLAALADPQRAEQHPQLKVALREMGSMAVGPLMGAMTTNDPRLKADAIELLGALGANEATMFLVGPSVAADDPQVRDAARLALERLLGAAPSAAEAQRVLYQQVKKFFERIRPLEPDHEGLVELWSWNDRTQQAAPQSLLADEVAIQYAARLTPWLVALDPEQPELRRLHFTAQLEAAKLQQDYAQPLPNDSPARTTAAALSIADLEEVLQFAQQRGYYGAAAAVCEILGAVATPEILISADGSPAPLVQAVQQGDRRLKFAALAAVMQLASPFPYPGSSHVADALGYFTATAGERRAVVAHPRAAKAQNLAALLGMLAYETEVVYRGEQLFDIAKQSADFELVLVHTIIDEPLLGELLSRLRRDPRTAHLPVGIIAPLDALPWARELAARDSLTEAFVPPQDAESLAFYVEQLDQRRGRNRISPEEREQQAAQALAWIGRLAAADQGFYELRRLTPEVQRALEVAPLSVRAASVLSQLGTPAGQRALVDLASRAVGRLELRQAAAAAFQRSVAEHGILLTTPEIVHQYDLYNASAAADRATQQLRGLILDALESKTRGKSESEQEPN